MVASLMKRTLSARSLSTLSTTGVTYNDKYSVGGDSDGLTVFADPSVILQLEEYDADLTSIVHQDTSIKCSGDSSEKDSQYIYPVHRNDVNFISVIGSGQFCNVYSVTGCLGFPSVDGNETSSGAPKRSMYALKSIDAKRVRDSEEFVLAATDLANEAILLSQFQHKNIVGLRGVCAEGFSQSYDADGETIGEGYFLVLDILKETLSDRLNRWRKQQSKSQSSKRLSMNMRRNSLANADDCQRHRMYRRVEEIAYGIAEGMNYLHSQNVVLRDLKPRNIGFDYETNMIPKIFDFGFARLISECNSAEICGSPRYMAPEAIAGSGYSLKVDIFSFGVVLFEICSLCVPYNDNYWNKRTQSSKHPLWKKTRKIKTTPSSLEVQLEGFYTAVVEKNLRPCTNLESTIPCKKIRSLIQDCWETNPDKRPSFPEVLAQLDSIFETKRSTLRRHSSFKFY